MWIDVLEQIFIKLIYLIKMAEEKNYIIAKNEIINSDKIKIVIMEIYK